MAFLRYHSYSPFDAFAPMWDDPFSSYYGWAGPRRVRSYARPAMMRPTVWLVPRRPTSYDQAREEEAEEQVLPLADHQEEEAGEQERVVIRPTTSSSPSPSRAPRQEQLSSPQVTELKEREEEEAAAMEKSKPQERTITAKQQQQQQLSARQQQHQAVARVSRSSALRETDSHWEIVEPLPRSMPSENIRLELQNGYLHLHGQHSSEHSSMRFEKWIRLPGTADASNWQAMTASLNADQVLTINVPKCTEVKPTVRIIPIQSKSSASSSTPSSTSDASCSSEVSTGETISSNAVVPDETTSGASSAPCEVAATSEPPAEAAETTDASEPCIADETTETASPAAETVSAAETAALESACCGALSSEEGQQLDLKPCEATEEAQAEDNSWGTASPSSGPVDEGLEVLQEQKESSCKQGKEEEQQPTDADEEHKLKKLDSE